MTMFFRKAASLKFFLGRSKASWTPLLFPIRKVCLAVSCIGIGSGLAFSILTSEADGSLVSTSTLKLQKMSSFLPSVYAASNIEEIADEDINKSDPKSKALEIKSLDIRKTRNFIAVVAEHTAPAVVHIEIRDSQRKYSAGQNLKLSNGSGFIVKENGLILTNAHVVKGHSVVSVKLHDGRVFQGRVEHVNPEWDLATVRIPCTNLPVLRLGNSADVRSGEFVLAMGSPRSLSDTVTHGVVSCISRRTKKMNYIQTDAAITFGNSGGPLVNLDGEAIGINSKKMDEGISFAIPIDYGKVFLKRAERTGVAEGPVTFCPSSRLMGLTTLDLTPAIIQELKKKGAVIGRDKGPGLLVWSVLPDSPSFKTGILPGDFITAVNGRPVFVSEDLYAALKRCAKLELEIWRKNEKLDLII